MVVYRKHQKSMLHSVYHAFPGHQPSAQTTLLREYVYILLQAARALRPSIVSLLHKRPSSRPQKRGGYTYRTCVTHQDRGPVYVRQHSDEAMVSAHVPLQPTHHKRIQGLHYHVRLPRVPKGTSEHLHRSCLS